MSKLRKQIGRIGRSDRPMMGFGQRSREKPRAALLGARVTTAAEMAAAREAGADVVLVVVADAAKALEVGGGDEADLSGALLDGLAEGEAVKLDKAGFDFVVAPLQGTKAAAVDPEGCGFVPLVAGDESEDLLRSMGPLQNDAIALAAGTGLTLPEQLALARVALLSGAPLVALLDGADASVADLRVLRDAGAAVMVAPAGATPDALKALGERLREVPPRRPRDEGGGGVPFVPQAHHVHDDEEEIEFPED